MRTYTAVVIVALAEKLLYPIIIGWDWPFLWKVINTQARIAGEYVGPSVQLVPRAW